MTAPEICPECQRRVSYSGGHHFQCSRVRTAEAWKARYEGGGHIPVGSYDFDGFEEYQITGGLTESEFFGGDIGDKA